LGLVQGILIFPRTPLQREESKILRRQNDVEDNDFRPLALLGVTIKCPLGNCSDLIVIPALSRNPEVFATSNVPFLGISGFPPARE
jgi:hypothetical protein